ncbi:hypothetical protein ADUPG1_006796 [Aduncisulcus paluster]|uniref:Amino acid transporter transmembrane domain-containing protein n=1 Tax=Aduncisulcus paluster TaxID=2918883 RepID=A0ABQ5KMH3_9EUKA|nr:hypothetical protein ADUPG1_006796 [Aduncisulcus paluster]
MSQEASQFKNASIISAIANLGNTTLGSGVLALPYAFFQTGWLLGIFIVLLITYLSSYGYIFIYQAAQHFSCSTFSDIGLFLNQEYIKQKSTKNQLKTPLLENEDSKDENNSPKEADSSPPWPANVCEFFAALSTIGACIAYPILITNYLPQVISGFAGRDLSNEWYCSRLVIAPIFGVLVLLPLSMTMTVDFLKFTSSLSLICVAYCAILIFQYFIRCCTGEFAFGPGSFDAFNWEFSAIFQAIPTITFSFVAHYNLLNITRELKDDSMKNVVKGIIWTEGIVSFVYMFTAMFGYGTWRDDTGSNVIMLYPYDDILAIIARICLSIHGALTYPLAQFSLRLNICKFVYQKRPDNPAIERWISVGILILTIGIVMITDDLGTVLSIVGSISGAPIAFIIPGLFRVFYAKLVLKKSTAGGWILFGFGCLFCVVGFTCSIIQSCE